MKRIDEIDSIMIDGVKCCRGHALPFGATPVSDGGINFSINSVDATACDLQLYHQGEKKPFANIRIPDEYRTGSNYSIIVFDQNAEELEYTYRFYGKWEPENGYRFDPKKSLLDPYARLISGREIWGDQKNKNNQLKCKIVPDDYEWEGDTPIDIPFEDLIIYEMHVRGFTKDESLGNKYAGTFAGVVEMIPYLKELGVNAVELLPVFEFNELEYDRSYNGKQLYNYWGYSTVSFFAPKSAYAVFGSYGMAADEMKNMVKRLHQNGIEVILDVVFNHTAEMDDRGPVYNYRGIDNKTYYHLNDEGYYMNYSGCGNTVNCNNAVVREHILDCLRYWVTDYHVDGFRFDEAPILSRDEQGRPMQSPPLLETLAHDPILRRTKLIAEAWDAAGLYQVGSFPAPDKWADWNGKFRDCVRHFIRSDAYVGPELVSRIQGSPDVYYGRSKHSSVNFVTCHDGFTLNDLVSYNEKHNIANGEDNRDGIDNNISWNSGFEGATDIAEVEALRNRQVKNACALLMLSRGTPMMLAGDEFRNSQNGNNNAYCQDGPLSWLNWENKEKHADVLEFYKAMIKLRNEHPVLRRRDYFTDTNSSGYPELSFHGERAWNLNMWEPFHVFGFMYAEPKADFKTKKDCFIYCGVNSHWEEHTLELPQIPEGMTWKIVAYSADTSHKSHKTENGSITLMPRSLMVLIAR